MDDKSQINSPDGKLILIEMMIARCSNNILMQQARHQLHMELVL